MLIAPSSGLGRESLAAVDFSVDFWPEDRR